MAKRNKPPDEFDLEGMINHLERENYGEPLSVFENVILLEEGPDEKRQYVFTLFWLSKDSPTQKKSYRKDGLFVRAEVFHCDPYLEIHGKRGSTIYIVDMTGHWTGKVQYP